MPYDTLRYDVEGAVATIALDQPETRNALSDQVLDELLAAFAAARADAAVRCVVLTSTHETVFSSGGDLAGFSGDVPLIEKHFATAGRFPALFRTIGELGKPTLCAANGHVLAGALGLALACDLIVAIEEAAFGLPEVKRGLVAGAGGLYRLPRALPKALALELIMTGAHFPAKRALEHGLVNRLVKRDQLMPEALKLAAEICENAPLAVRASLSVAKQAYDLDDAGLRELSGEVSRKNAQTEDYKEGPRAFIEKRAPRWAGR